MHVAVNRPPVTSIGRASRAPSPRPEQLSQISGVHVVIPVEVGGTTAARPPATQHLCQIGSVNITIPVKILRALGVALVQEQARHPFGMVDERVAVGLKGEHHVIAVTLNVANGVLDVRRTRWEKPRSRPTMNFSTLHTAGTSLPQD